MRTFFPRSPQAVLLLATLGAVLTANGFFWGHGHVLLHDAGGYYELSKIISQNGLFRFWDDQHTMNPGLYVLFELRTYGYPLFLALCSLFTNHDPLVVQIAVFSCQLLLCLAACLFCARVLQSVFKSPEFGTWLYVCTVLNPYVLIHTTELLSDLLSAVLVYVIFALSLKAGLHGTEDDDGLAGQASSQARSAGIVFLASCLAGFSVMVRPANIAVILALVILWSIRAVIAKRLSLRLLPVMTLGLFLPFVPQLANNYRNFHKIQPLVMGNVGGAELALGCWNLKYATVVLDHENPQLFYPNPFARREIATPHDFLRKRPLAFALTLALHGFALLDQDFPFTYIRDLHPWYRWPLSILNYLFLAGSFYGMSVVLRRFLRRARVDRATWAALAALILSGCYLGLYLPCQPEARYSLPVFFLWSPFVVIALRKIRLVLTYGSRSHITGVTFCLVLFVGCCMWLSSWIQSQAPQLRETGKRTALVDTIGSRGPRLSSGTWAS